MSPETQGPSEAAATNAAAASTHIRVARPTSRLREVIEFYCAGLGLERIAGFRNHRGFSGVMLGLPGASVHLEFTSHEDELEHLVGQAPTQDNLLVFYVPDAAAFGRIVTRMQSLGHDPVPAVNPYWTDAGAITFVDPDGWRAVVVPSAYA